MASDGFKAGFVVTFTISFLSYLYIYLTHVPTEIYIRTEFNFTLVSDLDHASRISDEFMWRAIFKVKKTIIYHQNGTLFFNKTTGNYTINITSEQEITSQYSRKLRGMEISELVYSEGELLGFCDSSGFIYKINLQTGQAIPKHFVISEDNNPEAFKMEWATKYGSELHVGSIGKEWVVNGETKHHLPNLIKIIDKYGIIKTKNWTTVYESIRKATNTSFPGYLQHEAVIWDNDLKRWLFLPRKASETIPYDEVTDETHGTNLLIQMNSWDKVTKVSTFGPLEKEYGFSSMKKIYKTSHHYLVLKTREQTVPEKIIRTKIGVIDLDGNMLSGNKLKKLIYEEWYDLGDHKYEGVEIMSYR